MRQDDVDRPEVQAHSPIASLSPDLASEQQLVM